MQQMTHASATFTTTDDVCAALLAFIASIDGGGHSESVAVPALRVDGEVMKVRMTVNAGSVFVVVSVNDNVDATSALAAASTAAVSELRARSGTESRTDELR